MALNPRRTPGQSYVFLLFAAVIAAGRFENLDGALCDTQTFPRSRQHHERRVRIPSGTESMQPPVSPRHTHHHSHPSAAPRGIRLKKELSALAVVVVIAEMHRLYNRARGDLRGEVRIGKRRLHVAGLDWPA